jgi:hypothetical protein
MRPSIWERLYETQENLRWARNDLLTAVNRYLCEPDAAAKESLMETIHRYEHCHNEFYKLLLGEVEKELRDNREG